MPQADLRKVEENMRSQVDLFVSFYYILYLLTDQEGILVMLAACVPCLIPDQFEGRLATSGEAGRPRAMIQG